MSTETPDTSRPTTARELVALMDAAWSSFRSAARSLSETAIERATPSGWTCKEMLAHVAAWHELAARRIRTFRLHGVTDPGEGPDAATRFDGLGLSEESRANLMREWDMDSFNAAVRDAAKARSAQQVLDELDASYRRVREEVGGLSGEQVTSDVIDGRSFAFALAEGDTFGHYPEHQEELRAALAAPEGTAGR